MAAKKIVLFIVEGISDETSLAASMAKLLNAQSVHFAIAQGDITTKYGNNPNNIAAKIGEIVKQFSGKIFKPSDFLQIVHLVDMDGAYIPDEQVITGNEYKNYYADNQIVTSKREETISRNHQKQAIIERMLGLKKVWKTIPYRVYYFSCNLDHVLHDNANLDKEEKYQFATAFETNFIGQPEAFTAFFCSAPIAVNRSYEDSWDFIKLGANSLNRYSNFAVYLNTVAPVNLH